LARGNAAVALEDGVKERTVIVNGCRPTQQTATVRFKPKLFGAKTFWAHKWAGSA